ncbi:MAG: hypothetical protein Unbinned805contig1001_31 [Prokaryotic dsDNA virus sp.]|jgi:hypothetical protein|nr:MAG: hypothetical protein Unbinned805contig1001_31 [Prokaryotic dsDNA virus sp.]|tara:strand:- start:942 stop:1334 length:393 start_codon:yes stop_codon:yes gene_type:complete
MKIVDNTGDTQIKFIFQKDWVSGDSLYLKIRSRSTNKVHTEDLTNAGVIDLNQDRNYYSYLMPLSVKNAAGIVENNYYDVTLSDGFGILYTRETLFCTNQIIIPQTNVLYDPNENQYKEHTTNNEFIILE